MTVLLSRKIKAVINIFLCWSFLFLTYSNETQSTFLTDKNGDSKPKKKGVISIFCL